MNKINVTTDIVFNQKTIKDITIVHLADIHFSVSTKIEKLDKIKEKIFLTNPDYIIITGDLIDKPSIVKNKQKIKILLMFLTDLAKITKVMISLGNHDIITENDFKFFNNLNELKNIYVLNNESYKDEHIFIYGLTLPTEYYYNITGTESSDIFLNTLNNNKNIKIVSDTTPSVFLVHSPIKLLDNNILKELSIFDLILCGHTHGGMVPRFLNKILKSNQGIIAPNKELFPNNVRGRIDKYLNNKNITIIINSGITKLSDMAGMFFKLFNFVYCQDLNKIIITNKRMTKK